MAQNKHPNDLAEAVYADLQGRGLPCPPAHLLTDLFETLYFASLRTEEGQPITVEVVYIDPDDPDPDPPLRIVEDRWTCVRLAAPIAFTVSDLVKLAKASDPRTSSLAVYHGPEDQLFIWGLIDQGTSYHEFVNHNSPRTGPPRPGIFQVSVIGVGHLAVFRTFEKIEELNINAILPRTLDALRHGPVREMLNIGIKELIRETRAIVPAHIYRQFPHRDNIIARSWISTLCRLVLKIMSYRHGGAILLTNDRSYKWLDIKYKIEYRRLREAIKKESVFSIQESWVNHELFSRRSARDISDEFSTTGEFEQFLTMAFTNESKFDFTPFSAASNADTVPVDIYLAESAAQAHLSETQHEVNNSVWFISLLSRVDGLVLMTPNLDVKGFGVFITADREPDRVALAGDVFAADDQLSTVEYTHFGSRHRSMMRYCAQVPGSIGFVISQDGDVRVMTRVRDCLVMWENIRLQHEAQHEMA